MTTTTNPGNYVDFDEYVGLKLEKTRSTIRTTDLLTALAGVAAMFLGYLLVFVVLDQWVVRDGFGIAWRWTLLSTLVVSTITWLVWKVGLPSFKTVNGLFAAREIERSEPELKSNLLNLIDLKSTGRAVNPVILKALERQAAVRLQSVDVAHAIDHRPLVRTAYVLLAVIVVFCFYALLSPKKISNSIWRGLLPAAEVPLATITEIIDVKPGDITIQAHQPFVDIQVDLAGEIPAQVWMLYSTADGKKDQPIELRADEQGVTRFKGQLIGDSGQGLMQDVTYVIRAGDSTSRQYKITVEQPPYAEVESLRIEFPSYMKLQPVEQSGNAAIDAWEGAKVLVSAKTNMPVRTALVQFVDDPQVGPNGEEVGMSVSGGRHLQAPWTLSLRTDGTYAKNYRIHCRTEEGKVTTGHVLNPITIRPDQPPEVVLLQPDRDLEAPANATIPLLIQARDPDFELGYLYLNVEKSGQKIQREQIFDGRQQKVTLKTEIPLKRLDAAAGDLFEFWIEAYDNKQPRPNTKNTPKVKIRIVEPVSQKEADRQLADQKERLEQKLADAEQETNPDQGNNPPPMEGDAKDRQAANDVGPRDEDPNQPKPPQQGQPQDTQNGQGQKNQSTANGNKNQPGDKQTQPGSGKDKQKTGQGDSQSDPSQNQPADNSKARKPLDSEGSQDDEVLQILKKKLGDDNPQKPRADQPSPEKPEEADSTNEPKPGNKAEPKPADKTSTTNKPAGADGDKPKAQSDTNPNRSDKSDIPEEKDPAAKKQADGSGTDMPKSGDKKSPPDSDNIDNKNPNADQTQKTGDKNSPSQKDKSDGQNDSGDKNKSDERNQSDKKQPNQQMAADKNEDGPKPNKPTGKSEGTDKQDESDTSAKPTEKKDQKPAGDQPEKQPGEGKKPTKPGEQSDPENVKPQPGDAKSNPNAPGDKADDATNKPKPGESKDDDKPGMKPDAKSSEPGKGQSPSNDSDKSDSQNAQTSKPKSDQNMPTGQNQQAPKDGDSGKPNSNQTKDGVSDSSSKPNGPKEQTADSPDAKKQPGDGTEKGVGKPDRDPNAKANPTKNDNVKRDPNEEPATRPSQNPADSPTEKTAQKPKSQNPAGQNKDPSDAQPNETDKSKDKMEGKGGGSNPKQDGDSSNTKPDAKGESTQPGNEKQADKSNGNSDPQKSQGPGSKKADGSKTGDKSGSDSADKPDSGDPSGDKPSSGGKKSSDGGKPGDAKSGEKGGDSSAAGKKPGDANSKDRDSKDSNSKDGKDGEKADGKAEAKDGGKQGSEKSGSESGKGKSDSGKADEQGDPKGGGKPGPSGKKGPPGGKPSGKPGDPTQDGVPGGGNGGDGAEPGRGGDMQETERSEDANLEYNRQAAELILQKLNKELERGEVDPETLEQLGWTEAQMKQFADRLSKSLHESKSADESPEAKARQQQFQEMLKNMDLKKSASQRTGSAEPKRDVNQVESKRTPPPPAYRSVYEKYTRELNRQRPPASEKASKK